MYFAIAVAIIMTLVAIICAFLFLSERRERCRVAIRVERLNGEVRDRLDRQLQRMNHLYPVMGQLLTDDRALEILRSAFAEIPLIQDSLEQLDSAQLSEAWGTHIAEMGFSESQLGVILDLLS